MGEEIRETCFDHQSGSDTATLSSSEYYIVNRMLKLARQYPDDVQIVAKNKDGSICVHVPWKWVSIKHPPRLNLTEEEKAERAARMNAGRHR